MGILDSDQGRIRGWLFIAALALLVVATCCTRASAQDEAAPPALDLGIIVVPTMDDAHAVIKQLMSGENFSILAKEKSVDATATDGGYLGKLNPDELRPELRDALRGRHAGELTDIVQLPSGFAILKILTGAPPTSDLNPRRISSLVGTGAIHIGAYVAGLPEANLAFQEYAKKYGWPDHSILRGCEIRTNSLAAAIAPIREDLASGLFQGAPLTPAKRIAGHTTLAQLYAYTGRMEDSVREWKAAYDLAQTDEPAALPNLEESLGTSYLHLSEIENGIYRNNSDIDLFPPLHPNQSFKKTEESKQAIKYFLEFLQQQPDDLGVRWQLNLAYVTLGEYPSGVPAAFLIPEKDFASKQDVGRFVDVASAAGLNIFRSAGGLLVDDFDNDGLLDAVVSSQDMCDPVHFFHNNGDGTFADRTKEAGLLNILGGLNMVAADYNNDGCIDILVLRGGWEFPQRMSLMRNNCNGTFTDVTDASGLGSTLVESQSAAWADIDNDGFLDLFVANENGPAKLFHNKGDGTFEEIGHAAGIDQVAYSKGIAAADYDGDGYMDFYVSNQNGPNFLYHNNGNLTFTEVGRQAGVQEPAYSFATWFFDYDNDGWPDIFVENFLPSVAESVKTYVGGPRNAETMKLYRNRHDGTFEDVTEQVGLDKVYMPMGANFGDIDNDGYLDIYLGMGAPSYTTMMPHELLRNDQGKSFFNVTQSSGTGELHKGHGIAFADLTRHGREDIVAVIGGAVPGDKHTMRVFANPGNRNNWLNVRLVGVKTNREAIGAQIHVTVQDGNATPRSIYRTVGQTSSFGTNPAEQNIGLGPGAHDVTLDISWPASKTRQHFTGVAVDQFIQIKEFANEYTRRDLHPFNFPKPSTSPAASLPQ
jgi:tetratricopeptide (TPR) repeat protein